MVTRAILSTALTFFLCLDIPGAEVSPALPSRNATLVLPLLSHFSSKEGYDRIIEILGKEDFDVGNAYRECFFRLKNSAAIEVKASLDGKKVYFILHGNHLLYSAGA